MLRRWVASWPQLCTLRRLRAYHTTPSIPRANVQAQNLLFVPQIQPLVRDRADGAVLAEDRHAAFFVVALRRGPDQDQVAFLCCDKQVAVGQRDRALAETVLRPFHLSGRQINAAQVDALAELAREAV